MTTPHTGTIAVFGATGHQGGSVVDALLAQGANVRALVRTTDSDQARALAGRGVELAYADADQPESLQAALKDVDAFFFMTTPPGGIEGADTVGETRQGIALANAAAANGISHVVFSSVGGAERHSAVPHFESKRLVEEHLEQLGIHTTVIRPVFFIENLTRSGPSVENAEIVLRLPLPDGIKLQMVAVRDIGRVAAAPLLGSTDLPAALEIAGDERTGSEIAAAFAEHTAMPARYEPLPIEVLNGQDDLQAMFRWFSETPAYQADIDQVRTIDPDVWDLPTWLKTTGYRPAL